MWKCNDCDGEIFGQTSKVTKDNIIMDKDGVFIESDGFDESEYVVHCSSCGNDGSHMDEIATWEGE